MKSLHRLILTSRTYRQSSQFFDPENARIDPENTLLWRMNRRRLEGEALWDAIHAVAGTINLKMGGRPVMPPLAAEELTNKSEWIASADPAEHTRRGLYILVRRNFRFPLFEIFDAPVNAVSCAAREVSTVAPQALWFLNNRTAFGQARHLAARLAREKGAQPADWVQRAWQLALGREPAAEELREAAALLEGLEQAGSRVQAGIREPVPAEWPADLKAMTPARASALVKFCLAVFNLNEFLYID